MPQRESLNVVRTDMQVVFLDFDGVIINRRSLMERRPLSQKADPDCVTALNHITDQTGAAIVVSSAWRLDYTVSELGDLLKAWGVTGSVAGKTPQLGGNTVRGDEIADWMKAQSVHLINVVILDDDADMGWLSPRLIRTEFKPGLTMAEANRAINLLRSTSEDPLTTLPVSKKAKAKATQSILYAAAGVVAVWERLGSGQDHGEALDNAIRKLREEQWRAAGLCVPAASESSEPLIGGTRARTNRTALAFDAAKNPGE